MKNDQAREMLENLMTQRGNGDVFRSVGRNDTPLIFPGMYGATPTEQQRLALAKAITGDKSKEGTAFMYKLIRRIMKRREQTPAMTTLSPMQLASMYTRRAPDRNRIL
jgi:hypothetical protein